MIFGQLKRENTSFIDLVVDLYHHQNCLVYAITSDMCGRKA